MTAEAAAAAEGDASTSGSVAPGSQLPMKYGYNKKRDYAAACGEQHIALIHCLKNMNSMFGSAQCREQHEAFWGCYEHQKEMVEGPKPQPVAWPLFTSWLEDTWASLQKSMTWDNLQQQGNHLKQMLQKQQE
jgi:hypothetical protein